MSFAFSSRLPWPNPDNELALLKAHRKATGLPILEFSESNPTRVSLDQLEGYAALDLGLLAQPCNASYDPNPRGLLSAREALLRDYARNRTIRLELESLFLCASTSEAYGWLFKLLCDPGDAVLVPKPGYPLFDYLAGLEAVETRPYRLSYAHPSGWRIDLDSVAQALGEGRAKALVLINPNNPTGSYVKAFERRALLELCERHGCALIVDEVFFDFQVEGMADGEAPSSFAGEDRVLTFVLDGLSKRLGLPQMKLGWIAASGPQEELRQACGRLEIIADSYLSAGTPIMNALPTLLEGGGGFAASLTSRLAENMRSLRAIVEGPLEGQSSSEGSAKGPASPHRVLRCEGGWTALIESPRFLPEEELAQGLLNEGLSSYPGYFFDMEREAFFSAGLILRSDSLASGAEIYRRYFEGLTL